MTAAQKERGAAHGERETARDELWAIACRLSPRHQSQLKLLARQARRRAGRQRRWWYFEPDYTHPCEIPAAPRLVWSTWRLWPLVRTVHDTALLGLAVLVCEKLWARNAVGAGWLGAALLLLILTLMSRRIGAAFRLMQA